MKRHAIIFVTTYVEMSVLERFRRIRVAAREFADTFLLIDAHKSHVTPEIPDTMEDGTHICFKWENIKILGLRPLYKDKIIPGSNHFILLWFKTQYPQYDYYWNIEYDVEYSGDWKDFFNKIKHIESDFLSTCIRYGIDNQGWYWLGAYWAPNTFVHPLKRVCSFNPIYRLSSRAVDFLIHFQREGAIGHHEVLMPTALFYNGFSIIDMGGDGKFVPKGIVNCVYTEFPYQQEKGSMRYRPVFEPGEINKFKGKLCHPVK